eukprot:Pgem_evm1s12597
MAPGLESYPECYPFFLVPRIPSDTQNIFVDKSIEENDVCNVFVSLFEIVRVSDFNLSGCLE